MSALANLSLNSPTEVAQSTVEVANPPRQERKRALSMLNGALSDFQSIKAASLGALKESADEEEIPSPSTIATFNGEFFRDGSSESLLPTIPGDHGFQSSGYGMKRISGATVCGLLRGDYSTRGIKNFIIIDCRYGYEYSGGHIEGAVNLNQKSEIMKFFHANKQIEGSNRIAVVFHCEFSQNRGPKSCKFFREMDRKFNSASYPNLCFPELYVLDGGYKQFFERHQEFCSPRHYISMWDEKFQLECKIETAKFRKSWANKEENRRITQQIPVHGRIKSLSLSIASRGEAEFSHRAINALESGALNCSRSLEFPSVPMMINTAQRAETQPEFPETESEISHMDSDKENQPEISKSLEFSSPAKFSSMTRDSNRFGGSPIPSINFNSPSPLIARKRTQVNSLFNQSPIAKTALFS